MKRLFPVSLLLAFLFLNSFSQDIDNEDFIITHGPYLQNLSYSGVTIIWTTNKPSVPGINLTYPDGKIRFIRDSRNGIIDGDRLLHKVSIDDLKPGTTYKYSLISVQILKYQPYKIYYGDTLSRKAGSFTTPAVKSEKVRFTVINDVHENSGKIASYLKKGDRKGQDLYFFNGDMIDYLQNTEQLFQGFIDTAVSYFASEKPFYYVRGNHETRGFLAGDLKNYFYYKDDKFYYSFDDGPVHFLILDCGEDKPNYNKYYYGLADYNAYRYKELEWLKKEVVSEAFRKAQKRIVIIHMPVIKDKKQNYGMKFLADKFGPVLNGTGINLMISAHTHRNNFYETGKSGFDYPLLVNSNNSFLEVEVNQKSIKATIMDPEGNVINTYTIK